MSVNIGGKERRRGAEAVAAEEKKKNKVKLIPLIILVKSF